ncbi:ankyrin repeat domain-containing protein [Methylocapsa sp. D3K7]|uniref:ankyrin repeat domain-containing protein n=1 Tax=Methylocapsa sp. D3K7 TaxID=3041435 RepID=UPI00244E6CD2|nr:ankyrin repeat domain-containing protein [Methylocapsa sp. D3K7]WGJ13269.1 ankyrin repeat domain-containing protein [Methylocapsa sp. D3K7]
MNRSSEPLFDEEARQVIREKLLHYTRPRHMGVHALARKIENSHSTKPRIPISTLQRFLRDSAWTNDMYVGWLKRFAEDLPSPDPIASLGIAMAELFGSKDTAQYAETYNLETLGRIVRRHYRLKSTLEMTPNKGFCRVVEWAEYKRFSISAGVLVCSGETVILMLQDNLSCQPKHLLLQTSLEYGCWELSGRGTMVEFEPGVATTSRQLSLFSISAKMIRRGLVPVVATSPLTPTIDSCQRYMNLVVARSFKNLPPPSFDDSSLIRPVAMRPRQSDDTLNAEHEGPAALNQQSIADQNALLIAAKGDDIATVQRLYEMGVDINMPDSDTGLTALHLAVARNALDVARFLVSVGALFVPDRFGRMPTIVAAECRVSEIMCDYIVEAEAAAETESGAKGV